MWYYISKDAANIRLRERPGTSRVGHGRLQLQKIECAARGEGLHSNPEDLGVLALRAGPLLAAPCRAPPPPAAAQQFSAHVHAATGCEDAEQCWQHTEFSYGCAAPLHDPTFSRTV
jgi:hypothetical protein